MRILDAMAFCFTIMALCVSCSREEGKAPPAPTPKAPSESTLFQSFEGEKLREKCSLRFEVVHGGGSRSNVNITPPGDMFRDFSLRGRISEDRLLEILKELKADLLGLAKVGGVEVTLEPKEMVPDRLKVLPYSMFKGDYTGGLQGFYFTYRQGTIAGAVDVLAGHTTSGGEKEWMLTCSVHEAVR